MLRQNLSPQKHALHRYRRKQDNQHAVAQQMLVSRKPARLCTAGASVRQLFPAHCSLLSEGVTIAANKPGSNVANVTSIVA